MSLQKIKSALALYFFRRRHTETKIILNRFGSGLKGLYSQDGQDTYIYSQFFEAINGNKIPKTFIDIGCNHPIHFSNSYFFEMNLGFSCLAIDPITKYKNDWARTRPNAKLLNIALGDQEGEVEMTVFEDDDHAEKRQQSNDMFSTLSPSSAKHASATSKKERVSIRRAENVFREENLSEIGILSIDVEGFELQVISGIDFTKTSIHIAVIENNTDSRLGSENIRAHMKSVGFKFYARIWGMDDIYVNINSPAFRME